MADAADSADVRSGAGVAAPAALDPADVGAWQVLPFHSEVLAVHAALLPSGDVLFAGNVGRVDLPGADPKAMEASLARIAALPPHTRVFPGHGPATTIANELGWLKGFRFA